MDRTGIAVAAIGIAIAICFFLLANPPRKENYGQMRSVKKIPFSDCTRICGTYYDACVRDDVMGVNSGWCERRFGDGCIYECYYSNYHRTR